MQGRGKGLQQPPLLSWSMQHPAGLSVTRPAAQGFDDVSVATIGLGVLQALEYMHNNGRIHRDIKAGPPAL